MKGDQVLLTFNRGVVDRQMLGRLDLRRLAMSAEEQTNFAPRTFGPMMLRPGLRFVGEVGHYEPAPDDGGTEEEPRYYDHMTRFWGRSSASDTGDYAGSARTAFLAVLTGYDTEDFEGVDMVLDVAPPAFVVNGVTVTPSGSVVVRNNAYGGPLGRIAVSGTKYLDISSGALFEFSTGVGAVGFWMTDVGDQSQQMRFQVETEDGRFFDLDPSYGYVNSVEGGTYTYWGVATELSPIVSVRIINNSAFGTDPTLDFYGLDDFLVALPSQISLPGAPQGYPIPHLNTTTTVASAAEVLLLLRFREVASANNFLNDRGFVTVDYPLNYVQDSVADSAAAGTYLPTGGFAAGGGYLNVGGARLTWDKLVDQSLLYAWQVEGFLKVKAAATGTGEIMFSDNWFVACIDSATGKLKVTIPWYGTYYDGFTTSPVTSAWVLYSDSALVVDTEVHWRVCFSAARGQTDEGNGPLNNTVWLWVDGVLCQSEAVAEYDAETDSFPGEGYTDFVLGVSGSPADYIKVGGRDASNFTLCVQSQVRVQKTISMINDNATTQSPPAATLIRWPFPGEVGPV